MAGAGDPPPVEGRHDGGRWRISRSLGLGVALGAIMVQSSGRDDAQGVAKEKCEIERELYNREWASGAHTHVLNRGPSTVDSPADRRFRP